MFTVEFLNEGKVIQVGEKENLLEVMRKAGLQPDAPCGGNGLCGKCLVRLPEISGQPVKSCETIVDRDLKVETIDAGKKAQILTNSSSKEVPFAPGIRQVKIDVPPCQKGDSISDWTRMSQALMENQGIKEPFLPSPEIASKIGPILKETKGFLYAIYFENRVLHVSAQKVPMLMAGFDIGTTTVVGYLLNAENGSQIAVASRMNPQTQFGADVINRSNYTLEHGMEEVSACIREAINDLLAEMVQKAGASLEDIYLISIAGNTCMHHLFLGICVDSLVHSPYTPSIEESMNLRAADYGIKIQSSARLLMLPNIAGFVGADTVACLVSSDLASRKEWTLLIDIGTNGEMVLGKEGDMLACSTAAGPAFEGAGIRHGMRGSQGAISKAQWTQAGWKIETIQDAKPVGICGSGLLDLASELLRSGQMDEYGELENGPTIILADTDESGKDEPITLEQKDIRELQLAKAAIASGIRLLTEKQGITYEDIKKVWLAGAFGSFLSPKSACGIGMIPKVLQDRIEAIGNAAGEGAKIVLRNYEQWLLCEKLARQTGFLELACMPQFQDCYVEELEFPEQED